MDNDNAKRKFDLEDRLVKFVGLVGQLTDKLNLSYESQNLKKQIIRSSSSSALNYGEAMAAESRSDFIHKLSICLKELIETRVAIKIIQARSFCNDAELCVHVRDECSQLIGIFFKSIDTAKKSMQLKSNTH
jgi:four helix bundle protein